MSVSSRGDQGDFWSSSPSISADGRDIAFHSEANTLVPDDHNHTGSDVFVHDQFTGQTRLVSVEWNPIESIWLKGWNDFASISADGRYIAFNGIDPFLLPDFDTGGHMCKPRTT